MSKLSASVLAIIALFAYSISYAQADLVNITIDDQYGDAVTGAVPEYVPSMNAWSQGATCSGCLAQPDASIAMNGTWHDSTWAPGGSEGDAYSINLIFNGTAIYVYCILANYIQYATTLTNLSFVLDGDLAGYFVHIPTSSTDYEYNQLVYSNSGLSQNPSTGNRHQLTINTVGTTNNSLVLFDYALRTLDTEENPPTPIDVTSSSATASSSSFSSSAPNNANNPVPTSVSTSTSTSFSTHETSSSTTIFSTTTPAPSSAIIPKKTSTSLSTATLTSVISSSISVATSNSSTTTLIPLQPKSTKAKSSTPVIAGTVGGIVALLALLLSACLVHRRKRVHSNISLSRTDEVPPAERLRIMSEVIRTEVTGEASQHLVASEVRTRDVTRETHGNSFAGNENDYPESPAEIAPQESEQLIIRRNIDDKAEYSPQELINQTEQMQQAIAGLQLELQRPPDSQINTGTAAIASPNEQDLRRQILILQAEMEDMQAVQDELIRERNNMERLPNYDEVFLP